MLKEFDHLITVLYNFSEELFYLHYYNACTCACGQLSLKRFKLGSFVNEAEVPIDLQWLSAKI